MAASVSLPVFKRRISLFYDDEEEETPAIKAKPLSLYEKRLSIEIKEWNETVIGAENNTKDKFEADKSCLTESERQFIESAPDFDDVVKTSNIYCKKIKFFLNILQKKRELEDINMNQKVDFINTKFEEAINILIHKIPDMVIDSFIK